MPPVATHLAEVFATTIGTLYQLASQSKLSDSRLRSSTPSLRTIFFRRARQTAPGDDLLVYLR